MINIFGIFQNKTKRLSLSDKQERFLLAGVSVLVVFLLFCFFRRLSFFVYQTSDDVFLRMIVSGEMSGNPEGRLHFIAYPAGLLLALLYGLFPALPWYGLFLCFSFGLTMVFVLFALLLSVKTLPARGIAVLLFCLFSYSFLFTHIVSLQFTTVAGIAAAGALFLFFVAPPSESFRKTLKNYAGFLLLSAYAYCIRSEVLFMCMPFLGLLGLSKYPHAKKERRNFSALAGIFLVMLACLLLSDRFAYRGSDWRSFRSYSKARASIHDYEGYPD